MYEPDKHGLIFHFEETVPGQRVTCSVELGYPFRGLFLVFDKPEAFAVSALMVGNVNVMVTGVDVPAVALHRQPLILPVGVRHQRITLAAVNIEKLDESKLVKVSMKTAKGEPVVTKRGTWKMETRLATTPFYAELHGKILLGSEDVTPRPNDIRESDS